MAIAFKNQDKYNRAKKTATNQKGEVDEKKLIEEYKRISGVFVEGSNQEVDQMRKYTAIFDKQKNPSRKKVVSKGKAKKK